MTATRIAPDAGEYTAHELHRGERSWLETNCYVDLWIELLHSLRLNPTASMAFTVAMDFEGDQWTFFKQPTSDLQRLYGIDVEELSIWRSFEQHAIEQVRRGRIPLVEVDSFHLPDTAGVSYRIEHAKTTIAIASIDRDDRTLGYFHNAGYFQLSAADYDGLFSQADAALPPYTEIVKLDRLAPRDDSELRAIATTLVRHHVGRIPLDNPFVAYSAQYASDAAWLAGREMAAFHKYAFVTLRQCGACAELASNFLTWLSDDSGELDAAAAQFATIGTSAKAMQFKIARMIATNRPADVSQLLDQMEISWENATTGLRDRYAA